MMTIIFYAVLAFFTINGYRKGLVRKASGVLALLLSTFLVSFLLPTVTQVLRENTPVYEILTDQCRKRVDAIAVKTLGGAAGAEDGMSRSAIRALMDQYGLDGSRLDSMSDAQVEEFAAGDLSDYLRQIGQGGVSLLGEHGVEALARLTKNEQTRLMKELPVPDFVKKLMITYNNRQGYQKLQAGNFAEYLIHFLANILLGIFAFALTLLVVHLIVSALLALLRGVARLPILRSANRVGGLVVGFLQGLIAVWMLMLVISLLSGTRIGMLLMNRMSASVLLQPLYQSNLFLKVVTDSVGKVFR